MDTQRSTARILAPLAIIVFALALLVILSSGAGGGHSAPSSGPTKAERRDLQLKKQRSARRPVRAVRPSQTVYVVRTGDTLAAIAQRAGVTIEQLQSLNPNLDPQNLLSGQRIKLR